MFCGLLLCDKDRCLLQSFLHIQYHMFSYFLKYKIRVKWTTVTNFSQITRLIAHFSSK